MFKKSIHKKSSPLLLAGGEGFGLPSAEKLGVRGGYETALFLGGYTISLRTAVIRCGLFPYCYLSPSAAGAGSASAVVSTTGSVTTGIFSKQVRLQVISATSFGYRNFSNSSTTGVSATGSVVTTGVSATGSVVTTGGFSNKFDYRSFSNRFGGNHRGFSNKFDYRSFSNRFGGNHRGFKQQVRLQEFRQGFARLRDHHRQRQAH